MEESEQGLVRLGLRGAESVLRGAGGIDVIPEPGGIPGGGGGGEGDGQLCARRGILQVAGRGVRQRHGHAKRQGREHGSGVNRRAVGVATHDAVKGALRHGRGDGPVVLALLLPRVHGPEHGGPGAAKLGGPDSDASVARAKRDGAVTVLDVTEPRQGRARGHGDLALAQHLTAVRHVVLGELDALLHLQRLGVGGVGDERRRRAAPSASARPRARKREACVQK